MNVPTLNKTIKVMFKVLKVSLACKKKIYSSSNPKSNCLNDFDFCCNCPNLIVYNYFLFKDPNCSTYNCPNSNGLNYNCQKYNWPKFCACAAGNEDNCYKKIRTPAAGNKDICYKKKN